MPEKNQNDRFLVCCLFVVISTFGGCALVPQGNNRTENTLPFISSIGDRAVIAYNPDHDLIIPIEGLNISNPQYDWDVTVTMVTPLASGRDYELHPPGESYTMDSATGDRIALTVPLNQAILIIKKSVFSGKEANYPLDISVSISKPPSSSATVTNQAYRDLRQAWLKLHSAGKSWRPAASEFDNALKHWANVTGKTSSAERNAISSNDDLVSAQAKADASFSAISTSVGSGPSPDSDLVALGSRRFQVLSEATYRNKMLTGRFDVNEVNAFPLSVKDTNSLFGHLVADRFFVVSLTLKNSTPTDRLVSTGMIAAYGRVLVNLEIEGGGKSYTIAFTSPIQIAPISSEHTYALVAGDQADRPRNYILRTLVFTGTLATATVNGFYPGATTALRAVGIYGNDFLPALGLLWPDRVPGQLQNIVNFAMPEFIKVPANGGLGFKYLFFSKKELQGMIADAIGRGTITRARVTYRVKSSTVNVAYLSFDTLDIPFENVTPPTEQSPEGQADRAVDQIAALMARVQTGQVDWEQGTPTAKFYNSLSKTELDKLTGTLLKWTSGSPDDATKSLISAVSADVNDKKSFSDFTSAAKAVLGECDSISPATLTAANNEMSVANLNKALSLIQKRLTSILSEIVSGRSANLYASDISSIQDEITSIQKKIEAAEATGMRLRKLVESTEFSNFSSADASNVVVCFKAVLVPMQTAAGSPTSGAVASPAATLPAAPPPTK